MGIYTLKSAFEKTSSDIVTTDLVLWFDAANILSYPNSGTTWFNLVNDGRDATLNSSPVFSNDNGGSFTFSGANSATLNMSGINFTTQQTIIQVLRPEENDTTRRNPYNHEYAGNGSITHETNGTFTYYHGTSGGNGATYQGSNSTMTVLQNEIAMIAVRRDASFVSWFKNGVFSNQVANTYPNTVNTNATITLGSGYAGGWIGKIYLTMVYNRALTNAEIMQNYLAVRNRFNI